MQEAIYNNSLSRKVIKYINQQYLTNFQTQYLRTEILFKATKSNSVLFKFKETFLNTNNIILL